MKDKGLLLLLVTMIFLLVVMAKISGTIDHTDTEKRGHHQDQYNFDGDHQIKIDDYLFDRFVDRIYEYAIKADAEDRTIVVYVVTFQLFNLNFHHKRLANLDRNLRGVDLTVRNIEFPTWNKYHNLQRAIANSVHHELINTERVFMSDKSKDRKMIEIYLNTIIDRFGVKRI